MRLTPVPVVLLAGLAAGFSGCAAGPAAGVASSPPTPLDTFCLEAEQLVVNTRVQPALEKHADFDAFVKSKAIIDPLTIHQYVWFEDDAKTRPVMVSCKLKGVDHLNETFGPGTAGPSGKCQDLNRANDARIRARLAGERLRPVVYDGDEEVVNAANPGMTGPDWLKPYTMTWEGADGMLHVRTKGFRVDWLDPRYKDMPGRFRGVQYCHFVAPAYLERLLRGEAAAGIVVGREIADLSRAPAAGAPPAHPGAVRN